MRHMHVTTAEISVRFLLQFNSSDEQSTASFVTDLHFPFA